MLKKRDIKGPIDNVSVINFICNTYSIRIAIWISRTAIYCDTVLVGDTDPYCVFDMIEPTENFSRFTQNLNVLNNDQ